MMRDKYVKLRDDSRLRQTFLGTSLTKYFELCTPLESLYLGVKLLQKD